MQNNFPRIYSLSTIGIKQHYNADYLFHPYRTDFSGESGSGKSMIADMIQLILIGSSEFQSATDGNKDRDVKGMLCGNTSKASSRGYIFLNIEVNIKQYIVIGAYIESTSNVADMFIIQDGYNWETLAPLNNPIFTKDLIINNRVETLNSLCEKLKLLRMKSFRRRDYHRILYNNELLSLDLTKDETLKAYASILRAFSRGKGFKKESESLKKFLFGDDDKNAIKTKYDDEVRNITNDFYEHQRYLDEIELISKKQNLLKSVLEKNNFYRSIYSEYITKRYNYWNTLKKKNFDEKKHIIDKIDKQRIELEFIEKRIITLQIDDLNKILELKEVIFKLESQRKPDDHIEKLFFELHQSKVSIEKVEDWLKLNNNQLKKVKDWFYFQKNENQNKIALQNFTNYLRKNNILSDFDASNWSTDFENEKEKFPKRFEQLKQEIIELQSLSKFTDIENPESLLHWAIANLKFPILHNIESTLIYFQKYGKVKSSEKNGERYIPFPKDLFNNIGNKIKAENNHGFWLDLDGVYEYIEHCPNYVLDIDDPKLLIEPLKRLKVGVTDRLSILNIKIQKEQNLKNTLFSYSNLKELIDLYKRKNELNNFVIDEILKDLSEGTFIRSLELYNNRKSINAQFTSIQKEYENHINHKGIIESYNRTIKDLESKFFKENSLINISLIEHEIEKLKRNRSRLKGGFSEELLQKKYAKELSNELKLSKIESEFKIEISNLLNKKERLEEAFEKIEEELKETVKTNESLFKPPIFFHDDLEELINPESGGISSLKAKAEQSKFEYEKLLEDITKNSPYDKSISIGKLANYLLPTVFPTSIINEDLISNNITERLNKLTQDIQEIGSRKMEILGSIFNEVFNTYNSYLTTISTIDNYLKKKNKVITGGNRASLLSKPSIHFSTNWLLSFRKQLNTQMNNIGLFHELREEIDINIMMTKAFQQFGGSAKAEPEDLMNPKSYFDLEFDLKLDNDQSNSGSNGQTYTANALLCLARLSLIDEKKRKGLRIMPIDEAEGLGSNYDMLHELAKTEKYQLLTMAIETAGEITNDGQYIYIMNENNLADMDSYVPPFGIFSDISDTIEDIAEYISLMHKDE
jgi:exonuclease SbcC